jgi:hypothetical protein
MADWGMRVVLRGGLECCGLRWEAAGPGAGGGDQVG